MIYVWLITGFILLIKGAGYLVDGSSSAAKILKVPSGVIGLTIVAMGTSAPEAAVSIAAAVSGNSGIVIGNIIGSNIFNILVVLGIGSMVNPIVVEKKIMYRDFIFGIIMPVILLFMVAFDLQASFADGLILLGFFGYFMYFTIKSALKNRMLATEEIPALTPLKSGAYIILGLGAVVTGGSLVVDMASKVAEHLGLSQNLIGLSIVAIGTSLPELVTSIIAARKGENGLALGNVIGSNIFNIAGILGTLAFVRPIPVSIASVYDLLCLIVFSIVVWGITLASRKISKTEGLILLGMYIGYLIYIIVR